MEGWPVMPERARIVGGDVEVAQALEAREKRGGPFGAQQEGEGLLDGGVPAHHGT